jgi:hypothetical protein
VTRRAAAALRRRQQHAVLVDALAEFLRHRHAARALRQPLGQSLDVEEVVVDDHLVLAVQRLAHGLGVHVGVAVHVAADPGAESQDARQLARLHRRSPGLLQRGGQFLVETRDDPVQHLGEIEQHVLALVRDGQPLARVLLGLPARRELGADLLPGRAALGGRDRRIEPVEHQPRDALLLAQHRAARRLGRMGGEHRVDRDRLQPLEHLRQRAALAVQALQHVLESARLRMRRVVQVLAATTDPVDLLGEIHGLEPGRERPHEIACLGRCTAPRTREQRHFAVGIALAPPDGVDAIAFHEREHEVPALLAQDLADERAERVHVLAERRVLGGKLDVLAVHRGTSRCRRQRPRIIAEGPDAPVSRAQQPAPEGAQPVRTERERAGKIALARRNGSLGMPHGRSVATT